MRAVAVFPNQHKIELVQHPEPKLTGSKQVLSRTLEVGICGTDREIATFEYGLPPSGEEYLILGHECFAEVIEPGKSVAGLKPGDLVIPSVRRPCPDPCEACAAGRQDFCYTGRYNERGIMREHGFLTEFFTEEERYLNVVPKELRDIAVLTEPLTVTEKAWDQIVAVDRRLGAARRKPASQKALVLGAGPVGLLAAMKLRAEGYQVAVYSRGSETDKPPLVTGIGAQFIDSERVPAVNVSEALGGPADVVFEAMGAPPLVFDILQQLGRNGIFVFTGIPRQTSPISIDTSSLLYKLVLQNQAILGTVNAAPSHFQTAIGDLSIFRSHFPGVVRNLISHRFPIEDFRTPINGNRGIKNVITFN